MARRYPSIPDIVNNFDTYEELIQWTLENQMLYHPLVKQRINTVNYINQFKNAEDLTEWAIHHSLLNDRQVLNKIQTLYTCKWCKRRSESTRELRLHEQVHLMCDDILQTGVSLDNITHTDNHILTNNTSDISVSTYSQKGAGVTSEPPYIFRQSGQKTFSKNLATETTYKVKFTDVWKGKKLRDIFKDIQQMFEDVLAKAKGGEQDLGRVIVRHTDLNHPIVVPLDKWSNINANTVMTAVENVLNSDETLKLSDQTEILVGNISIPKGSGRVHVTQLQGPQSSIALKRSMLRVANSDHMCLATAVGRCFVKLCKIVTLEEFKRITENDRPNMSATMKMVKHRVITKSYLAHIKSPSNNKYRKIMSKALCAATNLPTDKPLTITDIKPLEDLLDVNILVLSARLGNKFCRVANVTNRSNIYLYLTENDDGVGHFDGIGNINGFFNYGYFCETCLKPYKNKGKHACTTTCDVCGSNDCIESENQMSCFFCFRTCRSRNCYQRHAEKKDKRGRDVELSMCERHYKCKLCKRVLERSKRKPNEHICGEWKCTNCFEYQIGQHLCYQRKPSIHLKTVPRKYFFYDFECTQNEIMNCKDGYRPGEPCAEKCTIEARCSKCRKCVHCEESWCGLEEHKVNFAVLQTACEKCMDEDLTDNAKCHCCGSRCEKCNSVKEKKVVPPCEETCGYRQRIFSEGNVAADFCSHIMSRHYRNTVLIAHNGKGYDHYPVLNAMIKQHGVRPNKILYQGSKIMYMHVAAGLDLTFLDSLNFLQMKLSKIPACFDLTEMKKGYFPHLFNKKENKHYVGSYPSLEYYGVDYMSAKERTEFEKWHLSKNNEVFDFQRELREYCISDVDILRKGCMKFREIMMSVTSTTKKNDKGKTVKLPGLDPFNYVTIASACQAIYRELFLEEEYETYLTNRITRETIKRPTKYEKGVKQIQLPDGEWTSIETLDSSRYQLGKTIFVKSPIAVVPSAGYATDAFSKASICWLEWEMEKCRRKGAPLYIKHALNEGEHRLPGTRYRLDGYVEKTKTAYEFHGCVVHGCPQCYPQDRSSTKHPLTKHTMNELYYATKRKEMYLKRMGYKYVCIWEHEYHRKINLEEGMKEYVTSLDVVDRLNVRDSFFGGRVNGIKLYHEVEKPGETIEYFDYTSLYPSVNKYAKYVCGHPDIITSNFKDLSLYFGFAKVRVLPPRNLFHPVLPYTTRDGKLKFPLCKKCADIEFQDKCVCLDKDRAIVGTWCTPELELAVSKGYQILKLYEVYHFNDTSEYDRKTGTGGLFAGYVNMFLKLKQEASGFPQECQTEEEKLDYIIKYAEKENIRLDYEQINKNPGLRTLAKICLNSFWGKFGQRLNMSQLTFLYNTEVDKFFQLLSDSTKKVSDFHIISDDMIQLEYVNDSSFLPVDFKTNVFLASFTTCMARLRLYELLDVTQERALYVDTDSIIFVDNDQSISKKMPIGNYLGELTNEIAPEDGYITKFVSSGPKSYAYTTKSKQQVCKVRGFSLESKANADLINFSTMKEIVVAKPKDSITTTNSRKISRLAKKRILFNRIEEKEFRMVYTKRRLLNDLTTLPFGYAKQ